MTPTLFGRIQTRIFLLAVVGGVVTAWLTPLLPMTGPAGDRYRATFVVRSIEPPDADVLRDAEVILARGPFTVDDELELLQSRRIELVVSKNSGGDATRAKIDAR